MGKILSKQTESRHYIDIDDPTELENLAIELRASKALPGQEIIRDLDGIVAIRYKPALSKTKYENMVGDKTNFKTPLTTIISNNVHVDASQRN